MPRKAKSKFSLQWIERAVSEAIEKEGLLERYGFSVRCPDWVLERFASSVIRSHFSADHIFLGGAHGGLSMSPDSFGDIGECGEDRLLILGVRQGRYIDELYNVSIDISRFKAKGAQETNSANSQTGAVGEVGEVRRPTDEASLVNGSLSIQEAEGVFPVDTGLSNAPSALYRSTYFSSGTTLRGSFDTPDLRHFNDAVFRYRSRARTFQVPNWPLVRSRRVRGRRT